MEDLVKTEPSGRASPNGSPTVPAIDGVKVIPLPRFSDERGDVFRMLRATDAHFLGFGEVYFSTVYAGVVKAWKNHERATVNFVCPHGRIQLVLFDERATSPTQGNLVEVFLGPDEYSLVIIPPGVWNGFRGLAHPVSIVANCATEPHDSSEFVRLDPRQNHIPYRW